MNSFKRDNVNLPLSSVWLMNSILVALVGAGQLSGKKPNRVISDEGVNEKYA